MHLSVVIPAYNEEARIAETLSHTTEYLARQPYQSEVLVVDDGSRDGTASVVRASFPSVRLLSYHPNGGKGHAVKAGMLAATGAFRVYYDADASTPIDELDLLWPRFEEGADVVIGSRSLPGSNVQVRQARYRESMGRTFNFVVRLLALTRFPDTQCGFKGFTAAACDAVFSRQTIEHFAFDVELLFIARAHGLRVEQVPVRWINCPHTRVKAIADSARMLADVVAIRLRALRGRYA